MTNHPLTLRFRLSRDDLVRASRAAVRPRIARGLLLSAIGAPVLGGCLMWPILMGGSHGSSVRLGLVAMALGVLVVIGPLAVWVSSSARLRRELALHPGVHSTRTMEVRFGPDELVRVIDGAPSHLPWSSVRRIARRGGFVFVELEVASMWAVPESAAQDPDALVRRLEAWRRGAAPVSVALPAAEPGRVFRYTLGYADFLAWSRHHAWHRAWRSLRYRLPVAALLGLLVVMLTGVLAVAGEPAALLVGVLVFGLIGAVGGTPWVSRYLLVPLVVRRKLRQGELPDGETALIAGSDGLELYTRLGHQHLLWSQLSAAEKVGAHLFLRVGSDRALVVPDRTFDDLDAARAFAADAARRIDRAPLPAADVPVPAPDARNPFEAPG